jgi:hypothetical protein
MEKRETYILIKDFNWFGKTILSGAVWRQYETTKDNFRCFDINGNECPHWDLTFMTIINNPEWFMRLNEAATRAALNTEQHQCVNGLINSGWFREQMYKSYKQGQTFNINAPDTEPSSLENTTWHDWFEKNYKFIK